MKTVFIQIRKSSVPLPERMERYMIKKGREIQWWTAVKPRKPVSKKGGALLLDHMVGFAGEVPFSRHSYYAVFVLSLHLLTAYYQAIFFS